MIAQFNIDRRPIAMVANFGGLYDQTPSGQPSWIYEDGGVRLMLRNKVTPLYEMGYRRIILHLPAGTPQQDRLMTSAQWGYMPKRRQDEYKAVMKLFLDQYPDLELGVYMGYEIYPTDPTSGAMPETGEDRVVSPNPEILSHRHWFQENIVPFVDLGFSWFCADASSGKADEASKLSYYMNSFGLDYVGEALPTVSVETGTWDIRANDIIKMPWLCMHFFAEYRDGSKSWAFDPKTTEVSCVFSGHSVQKGYAVDEGEIRARAEQGFVLGTMFDADHETTKLVYDIGMEYLDWEPSTEPDDIPYVCEDHAIEEIRYESLEALSQGGPQVPQKGK